MRFWQCTVQLHFRLSAVINPNMKVQTWQRFTKRPLGCLLIAVVTVLDAYSVLSTIHEAAVAALFSMLEPYGTHTNYVLWGGWGRLVAALDQKPAACRMCYWEGCVCLSAVTAVVSLESILFNYRGCTLLSAYSTAYLEQRAHTSYYFAKTQLTKS